MNALAVLLPIRAYGGHEKMLVEWLGGARARHGLQVQVYCADNEHLARACEAAGLPAIVSHPRRDSPISDFFITWRLLGRIPAEVPLLFAPNVLQALPLQWLAAFLRRRRVAGYVPMAYPSRLMGYRAGSLRDWIARRVARRVDLWITITTQQRDLLVEKWRVTTPVLVVPNRLALRERPARDAGRAPAGPLRVLFVGRFDRNQKGLDWLCDRLRARHEAWRGHLRFTFKGEGAFGAELARLSRELGAAHVEVCTWGEVGPAMAQADVLLLPSRFEGLPLAAIEATHHGLPIVASRNAGVADFAAPSCLFEFGDEEAMLAALRALRAPERRAAALAHARARLQHAISPSKFRREVGRVVAALARMGAAAAVR